MSLPKPSRHRGVALITAMLVVAVTSIAVTSAASRQLINIRRTENVLNANRALLAAYGVEAWGQGLLATDMADDAKVDHLGEDWAKLLPPTKIEGGRVTGEIEDLQGRFNLNNLMKENKPSDPDIERFSRLLETLKVDTSVVQAILDWMDDDLEPRYPDGAEDEVYQEQEPPYRSSNHRFVHPSELGLVAGLADKVLERLIPHVCVLPERTTININTATAPVLMSIAEGLTERNAEALAETRKDEPFTDIEDFLKHSALAGLTLSAEGLGVESQHFRVLGTVTIGTSNTRLVTYLQRVKDKGLRIWYRHREPGVA